MHSLATPAYFLCKLVPEAGIEPARYHYRWILSPVRLPVSPLGQRNYYNNLIIKRQSFYLSDDFIAIDIW